MLNITDTGNQVLPQDDNSDNKPNSKVVRGSRTCIGCRKQKAKCTFATAAATSCDRCSLRHINCIPYTHVQRQNPPSMEMLEARLREKDQAITDLLEQCCYTNMKNVMREWTKQDSHVSGEYMRGLSEANVVATISRAYPGHGTIPDIVKYCCLLPNEIEELFQIFYNQSGAIISIVDPEIHTPASLIWTSHFLFTGIIAVAARQYTKRIGLHDIAHKFYKYLAARIFVNNPPDINTCLGYVLLTVFPFGKKRWIAENILEFAGLGARMAIQLELYKPPPSELSFAERMNWERTWHMCWLAEEITILQLGKWSHHRLDKYNIPLSAEWRRNCSFTLLPIDWCITGCVELMSIMVGWRKLITEGRHDSHNGKLALEVALNYDSRLATVQSRHQYNIVQIFALYARLLVLSTGFQFAFKSSIECSQVLAQAIFAAQSMVQLVLVVYPHGITQPSPDTFFSYFTFSTTFLISILRPKTISMISTGQQYEIVMLISRYVQVLEVDPCSGSELVLAPGSVHKFAHRLTKALLDKYTPLQFRNVEGTNAPQSLRHSDLLPLEESEQVILNDNEFTSILNDDAEPYMPLAVPSRDWESTSVHQAESEQWFYDYMASEMGGS